MANKTNKIKDISEIEKAKAIIEEAEKSEKECLVKEINAILETKGYTFKVINQLQGNVIVNSIDLVKIK
jgi:hypothetical protein